MKHLWIRKILSFGVFVLKGVKLGPGRCASVGPVYRKVADSISGQGTFPTFPVEGSIPCEGHAAGS